MFNMFFSSRYLYFWTFFCAFLALEGCCLDKDEKKVSSIQCRLRSPCCYSEPCDYRNCTNSISVPNDKSGKTSQSKPCLDKNKLLEAVKEALDHGKTLLENENVKRWGTGKWTQIADNTACELKTCVQLNVPGKKDKSQTKPMRDVLQIVSFADFVDKASKYTHWKVAVRNEMKNLEKKMMNIACTIAASLSNHSLNLLESTDVAESVPSHLLCPMSKNQGSVATYILLQKIEEFFNRLVYNYNTSC